MYVDYNKFQDVNELKESNLWKVYSKINEAKETPREDPKEDAQEKPQEKEVVYADLKQKPTCIFKNIIVFTNDRSDDNKTLKNIKDAIEELNEKPKLYVFVAANCGSEEEGRVLWISDGETELKIKDQTNLDTLVFSRLGVQGETCCEEAVKLLQDRGFLVLNPVRYSEIASNKLQTAHLLEKAEIPQPRFCGMNKSILNDEKLFNESMERIFPKFSKMKDDEKKEAEVVIKILDGHGGVGCFMSNCKHMMAILQTIFAIDPERELIIQKKEEGDGGDIRVHVLTLKNKQVILGCMKREQLGGDFRSNVSLGAEAKPIKLTPEQEQIALRAAEVSKLPWAAVDIMPLVKGSNPEIGNNVVLELNASPGTSGISEVLKHNFINILLNELDDPSEFVLQDKVAGYIESVTVEFDDKHIKNYLAKLDTGNSTPHPTLEVGEYEEKNGNIIISVDGNKLTFKNEGEMKATTGNETTYRPTIKVPMVQLGQRKLQNVVIAIVKSRENKTTNMLLNRDSLSRMGYVVSPLLSHVLTDEIQKVKIIN